MIEMSTFSLTSFAGDSVRSGRGQGGVAEAPEARRVAQRRRQGEDEARPLPQEKGGCRRRGGVQGHLH